MRERKPDLGNPIELWLYALTKAYTIPDAKEEVMAMSPGVDAFMKKYDRAAADPDLQRWRQKVEEGRLDQLAYIADRVDQARDEDIAIIRAIVQGEPIEAIAETYRISVDKILAFQAAMHSKDT